MVGQVMTQTKILSHAHHFPSTIPIKAQSLARQPSLGGARKMSKPCSVQSPLGQIGKSPNHAMPFEQTTPLQDSIRSPFLQVSIWQFKVPSYNIQEQQNNSLLHQFIPLQSKGSQLYWVSKEAEADHQHTIHWKRSMTQFWMIPN